VDEKSPGEIWICIEGHNENRRQDWEMARMISYYSAFSGNVNHKRFPKTFERFLPFQWDKEEKQVSKRDILEEHARMVAIRKQFENKN